MPDLLLVGGGLANGVIAYRLKQLRPELSVRVLEAAPAIGGTHTWSFHAGDLTPDQHAWLAPFVVHRWPDYEVVFPNRRRRVATGYASVTADRFREVLQSALGDAIETVTPVVDLRPDGVSLADGRTMAAGAVIDGRGARPSPHLTLGFQKFLGQELELATPHGLARPVIMDATVPQADGYRFVYLLPFSPTRLLVEDTYYADGDGLEADALRTRIGAYLDGRGWRVAHLVREEQGVLPIALGGDVDALWAERDGVPASGLAAALFHPTTGYSLPDAVRLADRIAAAPDLSASALFRLTREHARTAWRERGYFRLLNRLLFRAGAPSERYRVLEHFHRLPDPVIGRFYAATLSGADRLRIMAGKPPVPVGRALGVLVGRRGRG
ncbi:lycopene beta-cyclase CrtY [Aurantimonas sp. MSK8Z-1]|uniref:lycopene beta-cyclase CrtY n=1 Tax=Mangrovibrevibacter kandeliae TaxID=2968473 RepID=UPI0021180450|nr:lycopene beta-cyclase CrtY [Aurantimonas sp. MSK8Z-1]MCW4115505.1 lycopene beta-cyclase CrtY [Aurantimonas sp. MSK8Z-1]